MAGRPEKYTVSYFPHYTKESRSMYIIESNYGIEGYGFWFKLLEILCNSKDLFYSLKEDGSLAYLLAKTKVSQEKAIEILNTLSSIGCIDNDLWQHKIIWSQNLADNVMDVFKRRKSEIPQKPIYDNINSINVNNNSISADINTGKVQKTVINAPQSKLNEIKLNNISTSCSESEISSEQTKTKKIKIIFNKEKIIWENITGKDVDVWQEAYPACNLELELNKMIAWMVSNPKKAPKSNYARFINGWLSRQQDKGGTK